MFTKAKTFARNLVRRIKAEDVATIKVEIVTEEEAIAVVKSANVQRRNSHIVSHVANLAASFVFGFCFAALFLAFPEIFMLICAILCWIKGIDIIANFFVARINRATKNFNNTCNNVAVKFNAELVREALKTKSKKKAAKAESSPEVMTGDDAEPVMA